eukprot:CAMPEP_0206500966 /NCGR_PEP_ID=MMETSP0324_2-20121206/52972_1 /ASSEMBLY_ACC=CAM_ASM_000836 /TAXON_ID=2866 /ORGANISM="Crypthecodinium cohnii, Strain Seligo" /LENGTH=32 /DNA_ID= /DNA_START= /DNA_END= /DNA_ORIENTATION=
MALFTAAQTWAAGEEVGWGVGRGKPFLGDQSI